MTCCLLPGEQLEEQQGSWSALDKGRTTAVREQNQTRYSSGSRSVFLSILSHQPLLHRLQEAQSPFLLASSVCGTSPGNGRVSRAISRPRTLPPHRGSKGVTRSGLRDGADVPGTERTNFSCHHWVYQLG